MKLQHADNIIYTTPRYTFNTTTSPNYLDTLLQNTNIINISKIESKSIQT
jgi:hypothetical protein